MIAHPTLEVLSAHLDGELSRLESTRVRRHLDEYVPCRRELEGLRRTVGRLRELERAAPSDLLETRVRRQVAVESDARSLADRFELRRFRLPVQSSTLLTFALVVAFAVMLFVFAEAVERQRTATIPVELSSGPERESATSVPVATEWIWVEGRWSPESVADVASRLDFAVRRGSPEWEELLRHHPELGSLPGADGAVLVRLHEDERLLVLP